MLKYKGISLLILSLVIFLASSAGAQYCPVFNSIGDLSGNCKVDWEDLQLFADYWLDANCSAPVCKADLDGVGGVTMSDFSVLADRWLKDYSQITLVINEFMASNGKFNRDPADGDFDDWFEIYNYGDHPIDIGGMYVTDGIAPIPSLWERIPDNRPEETTIGPHGYLVIWADEEPGQGPLHVDFALSASGELIRLYDAAANPIDQVVFGPQLENHSYGRYPDGNDNWLVFSVPDRHPTPGRSNQNQPMDIVINEIMYHPYHSTSGTIEPEDMGEEYIELFNRGSASVRLAGWRISNGVSFAFPNDVSIDAGQYLVVAADVNTFAAKYPAVTNYIGGWDGRLSNSGEAVELIDDLDVAIDRVRYADEGEWAVRVLGAEHYLHRGWEWTNEHDGDGKSLELINPALSNECGQNWAASLDDGGTPGKVNSRVMSDIAPLITDIDHRPIIPGSNEPVTVTADVIDEPGSGVTVTLHYRVDTSVYVDKVTYPHHEPNDYNHVTMYDDGLHGDDDANDGEYGAVIPAHPDGTIIEFYVEASDAAANRRTCPAPSFIDGTPEQVTNLLYQVDDSFDPNAVWEPGSQPIYYLIMTEMENGRLLDIGDGGGGEENSDSQMNTTFVSVDGIDIKVRHNLGIRNRGHGSRNDPPNNYRVNFPNDRSWKGVTAINLNTKFTYLQLVGNAIFRQSGLAHPETTAVQVRVNGQNRAVSGDEMYGSYVHVEVIDNDFTANHISNDSAGNAYKCMRIPNDNPADLRYEGSDPDPYRVHYLKRTNDAEDDWSKLIEMTYALSDYTPDGNYVEEVNRVLDSEQWLRLIAINALLNNNETTLANGNGDDYYLYRGVEDPRFVIIQHDLDCLFGIGDNPDPGGVTQSIFRAMDIPAMDRFMRHPEFIRRYYFHLKDLIETTFSAEQLGPFMDNLLADFVPTSRINQMKDFVAQRNAYVLSLIPSELTIDTSLPQSGGYNRTTNPTVDIGGKIDSINTRSLLVNGAPTAYSAFEGTWSTGTGLPGELLVYLPMDTVWSYEESNIDLGTAWCGYYYDPCAPGDGSSWSSGKGLLYVEGDALPGPKNTPLNIGATTYYFRTEFYFDGDPNEVEQLQISTILDDGAIVYLNGNDVNRIGIDPGPISHGDYADRTVGNAVKEGPFPISTQYLNFVPPPPPPPPGGAGLNPSESTETVTWTNLYAGDDAYSVSTGIRNVIAVEVHQSTSGSTDVVWGMELRGYGASTGGDVPLQPGINRIIVQAFDERSGTGNELESEYIDVWYDDGNDVDIFGTLASNTILDAASGPWHVTGDIVVPNGITLTILPGTTLFFEANTGITVQQGGRLVAEGTQYQRIRLTHVPGGANWDGVAFDHTLEDNRLCFVDHEFGDAQGMSTDVQHSQVLIDNMTWAGTNDMVLNIDHPSVICRNSVFPSITSTEPLHGVGLTGDEYIIFDGCVFGTAVGYNDIIDFRDAQRPGPVFQLYNSIFMGGGDDGADFDSSDAHVEGNIFMNFHGGGGDGTSNAVSTGVEGGDPTEVCVVRNIFMNNDHAVLLKEDCFLQAENNTFVDSDIAVVVFGEPYRNPPRDPGKGTYMEGNIFWNNAEMFEHFFQEPLPNYGPTGNVNIYDSILPSEWHYLGLNNIDTDPIFVDSNDDFHLKSMSPAIGTGSYGLDLGAYVPAGAAICGEPDEITHHTSATLTIDGPGITHYKYSINDPNGPWSSEIPLPLNPYDPGDPYYGNDIITLTGLVDGSSYTVYAIGKNSAGVWQSQDDATASRTWTIDISHSKLIINEVLAINDWAVDHEGTFPDLIELYYDGPATLDLSDMSISDNSDNPRKYVFGAGATMEPNEHLVLYADSNTTTSGIHLLFNLDGDGEGVYLYDSLAGGGELLDSVEFGTQINNYSIGRVGYERQWKLNQPTFGYSNVAQALSDPATLKINEWLANEDVLFADDFIELFNPQSFPVDLGGLYLTDNPVTQPDKHEIPPLSFITGSGFAVFRADDRSRSGHVDFRLSASQEHIGLFDAELNVIDQVLYTPQTTDISQGRVPDGSANFEFFELPTPGVTNSMATTPPTTFILVSSGATANYYVPSDATSESTWMQSDFNDMAGWKTGLTSLGFGFGGTSRVAYNDCVYRSSDHPYIGSNVTTYGIGNNYTGPTSGPLLDQTTGDDTGITATLTQSGGVTWQASPDSGGSDCAIGTDAYNTFSGFADMTGVIYYGSEGWWVDLMFTGLDSATEYTFATSAARGSYSGRFTNYTITGADTYTNASTSGVAVLAENKVQFNTGDNYNEGYVARWTGITAADGSFTVRAEADSSATDGRKAYSFDVFKLEGGFSGTDVLNEMFGINTSLWSRIEFEVEDPCVFDTLTLRMKYEDGFVAYLNGVEVARENFTGIPAWNSAADSNRPNELATSFVEFDISDHISDLRPGTNVLAVQGLNDNIGDIYFLMLPELIASSDPGLDPYTVALRLLDGLRITEIMYNTPATTSEYDYIELQNISDVNLDLTGVRFTEGIEFTFPPMQLAPGEYVVVDSNSAMFEYAYGTGINVAGEYSLELDNSGEGITLKLASPLDAAILRFGYDDRWYPLTDGQGASLTILDPYAKPASWDKAESWYAGVLSPGSGSP